MTHYVTNQWSLLDGVEREMRRLMGRPVAQEKTGSDWAPAVDIIEEDERFVLMIDVPGVDLETIDVSVEEQVLSVSGKRETVELPEKANLHRQERRLGNFKRSFTLPDSAQVDGISAVGKFGVLELTIPKKPVEGPRRIPVTH